MSLKEPLVDADSDDEVELLFNLVDGTPMNSLVWLRADFLIETTEFFRSIISNPKSSNASDFFLLPLLLLLAVDETDGYFISSPKFAFGLLFSSAAWYFVF